MGSTGRFHFLLQAIDHPYDSLTLARQFECLLDTIQVDIGTHMQIGGIPSSLNAATEVIQRCSLLLLRRRSHKLEHLSLPRSLTLWLKALIHRTGHPTEYTGLLANTLKVSHCP